MTTLVDKYGIKIVRFYGGTERGTLYQVTLGTCQRDLTETELKEVMLDLFQNLSRETFSTIPLKTKKEESKP